MWLLCTGKQASANYVLSKRRLKCLPCPESFCHLRYRVIILAWMLFESCLSILSI